MTAAQVPVLRSNVIDLTPDSNLDRVGRIAAGMAEQIRDEDPRRLYDELLLLCAFHPAKAAQVLMCFAAWFNPNESTETLVARACSIAESRVRRPA